MPGLKLTSAKMAKSAIDKAHAKEKKLSTMSGATEDLEREKGWNANADRTEERSIIPSTRTKPGSFLMQRLRKNI